MIAAQSSQSLVATDPARFDALNVVVAGPQEIDRRRLSRLAFETGLPLSLCEAATILDLARIAASWPVDAVLLDCGTGGAFGLDQLRALRALPGLSQVRLVVSVAPGSTGEGETAMAPWLAILPRRMITATLIGRFLKPAQPWRGPASRWRN
jgi:CheY-like chemotaxis protein